MPEITKAAYGMGDPPCVASGRVSFSLGFHGPCSSIDAACASALTAVHGAHACVEAYEASTALGESVSLKLLPFATLGMSLANMLSTDGRCKTFDVRANGMVRSEATGAAYLVPQTDALPHLAKLGASAVGQDGRSASLTAPNGVAQSLIIKRIIRGAGIGPDGIDCIQAHGTGTPLGDPTEAGALANTLGVARERPLSIGSHKSNTGHSESPSGMLGLLKTTMVLGTQTVYGKAQLRVMSQLVSQPTLRAPTPFLFGTHSIKARLRTTGVTAMGHSGTIAHTLAVDVTAATAGVKALKTPKIHADQWRSTLSRQRFGWFELKKKIGQITRTGVSDIVFTAAAAAAGAGGAGSAAPAAAIVTLDATILMASQVIDDDAGLSHSTAPYLTLPDPTWPCLTCCECVSGD